MVAGLATGPAAAGTALAIGLFNSSIFPDIVTHVPQRSTAPVAATSGLLCVAGVVSLPFGWIADTAGLSAAFLLPALAYAVIVAFAATAARHRPPTRSRSGRPPSTDP